MASIHKENGGLLDYSIESPVSTGVNFGSIQAPVTGQWLDRDMQYSIGAQPDDDFTRQIFDIVTGSVGAAPMAIGKISKAAITGGQALSKIDNVNRRMNQFKGLNRTQRATFNKLRKKMQEKGTSGVDRLDDIINTINFNNKLNSSRILMQKALDKYGIRHDNLPGSVNRRLSDPITEILRTIKYKQN